MLRPTRRPRTVYIRILTSQGGAMAFLGVTAEPGTAELRRVRVGEAADGSEVTLPVALFRGRRAGPTLYLQAGLHGDEMTGIEICRRVLAELDPAALSGTVACVPLANPSIKHRSPDTRSAPRGARPDRREPRVSGVGRWPHDRTTRPRPVLRVHRRGRPHPRPPLRPRRVHDRSVRLYRPGRRPVGHVRPTGNGGTCVRDAVRLLQGTRAEARHERYEREPP